MRLSRILVGIAVAGGCMTLTTGCLGFGFEEVTVGHAKPDGKKVSVPAGATDTGGIIQTDQWPSACALIDDSEIKAIFPQADDIKRKPSNFQAKLEQQDITVTVGNGTCSIKFTLPTKTAGDDNVEVTTHMDVVGTPDVVKLNHYPTGDEPLAVSGGASCNYNGAGVSCARGGIAFSFGIFAEDVLWKGADGHDNTAETDYAHQHVLPELAQTMASKLPA